MPCIADAITSSNGKDGLATAIGRYVSGG